jgi:hypothetical protein
MQAIYKLATTLPSSDAAAQMDIRQDGELQTVFYSVAGQLNADSEFIDWELSFSAVSGFATHDTSSSIVGTRLFAGMLTNGAVLSAQAHSLAGIAVALQGGERLYLHTNSNGPGVIQLRVYLYVEEKGGQARTATRRR